MKQLFKLFTLTGTLCLFLFTHAINTEKPKPPTPVPALKGSIVSSQLKTIPHFKAYYQGAQTISNDDGFFSFPLQPNASNSNEYSLLICKDFRPTFESINTVKDLVMPAKKPYLFFTMQKATMPLIEKKIDEYKEIEKPLTMRTKLLARQILKQRQLYLQTKRETKKSVSHYTKRLKRLRERRSKILAELKKVRTKIENLKEKFLEIQNATPEKPAVPFWFIKKKKLQATRKRRTIPSDAIIVCLNPKVVDTIKNWNFALAPNFVSLPRIVLKKNLETKNIRKKQSITRSALKSKLYSFEQGVFHEEKKEIYKVDEKKPNVKISMVQ